MTPDPNDPPRDEPRRSDLLVAAILLLVAAGGATDLVLDRPRTLWSVHVLFEAALMAASLGFAAWLWRGWRRASRSLERSRRSLQQHIAERDAWRASARTALAGFGEAINRQFTSWGLTPAERDVALLLLKGHGHKQAAAQLGRSERTIRQHAVSIYEKAGLSGRAELAAFFLEGLLVPGNGAAPGEGEGQQRA